MTKRIIEYYKNKIVNPKYYFTMILSGETKSHYYLNEQEFTSGNYSGLIFFDHELNRIVFHPELNK